MFLLLACTVPDPTPDPVGPSPVICGALPDFTETAELPIADLDDVWQTQFDDGERLLDQIYRPYRGVGPVYIRDVCAACHAGGRRGPKTVTKMVVMDGDAPSEDQSALPWGHTVKPEVAGGATTPIEPPDVENLLITERLPPALFGRGYLEAIEDAEIEAVEAEQAAAGIVSGRINRVAFTGEAAESPFHGHQLGETGLIGRFGLKARLATVDEFTADAFQGDMALTSPLRSTEPPNPDGLTDDYEEGVDLTVDTVNQLADYSRLLEIPARTATGGEDLFAEVGCAECHVPTLHTRADYPVAQLADIDAPVYTDLLLHDMGLGLADGMEEGDAGSGEWRTAPLIGLRHLSAFLHDGSADTLDEAIRAHGGEASGAVAAFDALSDTERGDLCDFVGGL